MTDTLRFYSVTEEPYGVFSNFSAHPLSLDGKTWPTSEHYFQAQKFAGTPHEDAVRRAPTPMKAAEVGRDRKRPLRRDWESVKDDVMRRALYAKFTQHPELGALLLSTGEAHLVEATTKDHYWGCGSTGTGKNKLGLLLMELRERLRKERGA